MRADAAARLFIVPPTDGGVRLDVAIAKLSGDISRRRARVLIGAGSVYVDGQRVRVLGRPLAAGSEVRVHVEADAEGPPTVVDFTVLVDDEDVLVVDKPAGAPTEASVARSAGSLHDALLRAQRPRPPFLAAAHRLDTDTSGVVIFARNSESAGRLAQSFQEGRVLRAYLALVVGRAPDRFVVEVALARDPARSQRMVTAAEGQPSRTEARLLASGAHGSLLVVVPRTGRQHQLRVHLAHENLPLAGDRRYGRPVKQGCHLGLHAAGLVIAHPRGSLLRTSCAPPPAFFELAALLGIDAAAVSAGSARVKATVAGASVDVGVDAFAGDAP